MSLNVLKNLKNVLMTSVVTATALSATNVFAEEAKYTGDYTIEAMINQYNVITLGQEELHESAQKCTECDTTGNLINFSHVIGPMIIEGDITNLGEQWEALAHSQRPMNISSYIKGEILSVNSGQTLDGSSPILYLGSANEGKFAMKWGDTWYNDNHWYSEKDLDFSDSYFDFKKLYNDVKEQQDKIKKGKVVTPSKVNVNGTEMNAITITYGEYYTIESLQGVEAVLFEGYDKNIGKTTVINITDQGDASKSIILPQSLYKDGTSYHQFVLDANSPTYDNATGTVNADEKIRNIVWNITEAEFISYDLNSAFVGHVIAPQADVLLLDTNHGGCMLVNSISSNEVGPSQLYHYPYGNIAIELEEEVEEPTEIVINVEKRAESVTGKLLAGAKLQLLDKGGNIIEEWTSTEEVYVIKAELTIGETYIIRETSAPEGYELAKDVTITIEDTEDVQVFTVVNVLEPEEIDPPIVSDGEVENPDTGDSIMLYIGIVAGSLVAIIALVVILLKMKKKKTN